VEDKYALLLKQFRQLVVSHQDLEAEMKKIEEKKQSL
jgi:hypothetical protein